MFDEPPAGTDRSSEEVCTVVSSGVVGTTLLLQPAWIENTATGMLFDV